MKVVLGAGRTTERRAAAEWCVHNLAPDSEVIAVVGFSATNDFVLGMPMFDTFAQAMDVAEEVRSEVCEPLISHGFESSYRLVHRPQAQALFEVARDERAELIVVGKQPHGAFGDIVRGEMACHLVHQPPCPVLVIPIDTMASTTS